jgi:hypothetical protein
LFRASRIAARSVRATGLFSPEIVAPRVPRGLFGS